MATTGSTGTSNQHPTTAQPGDGVDITVRRARGAFPGKHVLLILVASLALVVVAFMVAFATNPTTPVSDGPGSAHVTEPATAEQFSAPEPAPKQPG
jgi:hypothetical protein